MGMGQPQGQWGQGQPQGQWAPPPKRRNIWPIALLLLLLLLGGGGIAWFVLQRGDTGTGSVTLAEGEVFMEPAAAVGPDPFSAQPVAPPPDPLIAKPALKEPSRVAAPAQSAIQASSGAQPGLYGGTQNNAACDKAQMIAFLSANPDKAAAWVAAQNADPNLRWPGPTTRALTAADIPAYVGALTPLVLTADTRVTNHSFVAGKAPPRQSVLQKGSAVLVDAFGVPRARCYCGNPLLPPVPSKVQVVYVGTSWPDFNPGSVSVVSPAPQPVTTFEVRMPDGTLTTITVGGPPAAASPAAAATNTGAAATSTGQPTSAATATAGTAIAATATASPATTATAPATAALPPTTTPPPSALPPTAPPPTAPPAATACTGSAQTGEPQVDVTFANNSSEPVEIYYISDAASGCREGHAGISLQPGDTDRGTVSPGDLFRAKTLGGATLKDWRVPSGGGTFNIP